MFVHYSYSTASEMHAKASIIIMPELMNVIKYVHFINHALLLSYRR